MSEPLVNYQIRSNDAAAVAAAVQEVVARRAWVSPPMAGWVTLFDQAAESQDPKEIDRVAHDLSVRLAGSLFTFVMHDDLFVYYLFEDGDLVDEYGSDPTFFGGSVSQSERQRWSGRPAAVLKHCPPGTSLAQVQTALGRSGQFNEAGFASAASGGNRLGQLADVLKIDPLRAGLSFSRFEREFATIPDSANFIRIEGRRQLKPWRGPVPPRIPPGGARRNPPAKS